MRRDLNVAEAGQAVRQEVAYLGHGAQPWAGARGSSRSDAPSLTAAVVRRATPQWGDPFSTWPPTPASDASSPTEFALRLGSRAL
ncbi:hypothetical protein [Frankia sp. Cas4]|uniref:hypothetical protein n=1 Tax=Frankia sp. Cas4 TaxID=3073927 RepID=UPI002AD1EB4A|nr:hypothetical protein [Frankia sp. Cas4]